MKTILLIFYLHFRFCLTFVDRVVVSKQQTEETCSESAVSVSNSGYISIPMQHVVSVYNLEIKNRVELHQKYEGSYERFVESEML